MIAKLIGGKNDGGMTKIPFDDALDVLPRTVYIKYGNKQLQYDFVGVNLKSDIASYEFSGVK